MTDYNDLLDHAEQVMRDEFGSGCILNGKQVDAIIDHAYQVVDEHTQSAYGMSVAHIPVVFEVEIERNYSDIVVDGTVYKLGQIIANDGRYITVEIEK